VGVLFMEEQTTGVTEIFFEGSNTLLGIVFFALEARDLVLECTESVDYS
jgi:hypothetical protein